MERWREIRIRWRGIREFDGGGFENFMEGDSRIPWRDESGRFKRCSHDSGRFATWSHDSEGYDGDSGGCDGEMNQGILFE